MPVTSNIKSRLVKDPVHFNVYQPECLAKHPFMARSKTVQYHRLHTTGNIICTRMFHKTNQR